MYKIIVVEDNVRINRYISGILKKALPSDVSIESAFDGESALQMAKNGVDAVITDIRMPKMSGIELITEVKKMFPKVKIVIISAYEDFKVAQEAIALKVDQYLLKPFDDKKIIDIAKGLYTESMGRESDAIKQALLKTASGVMLQKEEQYTDIQCQVMLLRFGVFGTKGGLNAEEELRQYIESMQYHLDYVIFKMNYETFGIVFYRKRTEYLPNVQGLALGLINTLLKKYAMINVYLSKPYLDICETYPVILKSYQELSCLLVIGKSILWEEDGYRQRIIPASQVERKLAEFKPILEKRMKAKNQQKMAEAIQGFFLKEGLEEYPAILIKRLVVGTAEKMLEVSKCMLDENILEVVEKELLDCYCVQDVIDAVIRIYQNIEKMNVNENGVSMKELSDQVLDYLKKHVYENVCLKDLVDEFHFSESYIVRVVSYHTGITPMKWSILLKVEEAKNMFRTNPSLKAAYVAEQLGFSDQRYFCKVFKNYEKMTISEYKKLCEERSDKE